MFWPKQKLTKGDLFRYYVQVAPFILPAVADRPLVMKRFPNGVAGKPFYQHRAADVPAGVRVEPVVGVAEQRGRSIIGGEPEDAALHDAAGRDLAGSLVLARRSRPSTPTTSRSISIRRRA